ncbi:hypothetical protein ATCV1_z015L [Acanthocystis turfacea chlorella virus 1]|uniref:Uncharacterized protein z015L n=1 Tax=Chlorovirus heliozoae TaxID=322019 RepID=A7K7X5_9PHYC|nr:hypothetical protein ATCV1_z015L [Acanthocystis turfacea chlorella virus 1]ABT16149.1 hypothetical protein ATCV1_z015L [Acanthocystis turfacea chlorella virus 1]
MGVNPTPPLATSSGSFPGVNTLPTRSSDTFLSFFCFSLPSILYAYARTYLLVSSLWHVSSILSLHMAARSASGSSLSFSMSIFPVLDASTIPLRAELNQHVLDIWNRPGIEQDTFNVLSSFTDLVGFGASFTIFVGVKVCNTGIFFPSFRTYLPPRGITNTFLPLEFTLPEFTSATGFVSVFSGGTIGLTGVMSFLT